MRIASMICALALTAAASAAAAQDMSATATYGEISRSSGFTPDPITVQLTSGGPIDASRAISSGCAGYIADAPDFEFTYSAGSLPLSFIVAAGHDTTLVVNGPDGQWYCNDDADGIDPILRWGNPPSGTYDIWVGSYAQGGGQSATLYITELN